MEDMLRTFEKACEELQVPETRASAEAVLLEFKKSLHPLQACRFILDHSQSPLARFQAASVLQEAGIREWSLMTPEDRQGLRSYCLQWALAHANDPAGYVRGKMLAVVAVLLKRGWLDKDGSDRDSFIRDLGTAVTGAGGPAVQKTALLLLEAIVSEFAPSTSSPMGLAAEYHEQCRASLETPLLRQFYLWAQQAAHSSAAQIAHQHDVPTHVEICAQSFKLMAQILGWDFRGPVRRNAAAFYSGRTGAEPSGRASRKESDGHPSPGPAFAEVLLNSESVGWVIGFYSNLRRIDGLPGLAGGLGQGWEDAPLAVASRQVIVLLCGLTGDVFGKDEGLKQAHLQRMLGGVMTWLVPAEVAVQKAANGSESELLDGCRALAALSCHFSASAFDQASPPDADGRVGAIRSLAALSSLVTSAGGVADVSSESWAGEVLDSLLDTWMQLLEPPSKQNAYDVAPRTAVDSAGEVFGAYVGAGVAHAAATAHDEDDSSERVLAATAARDERLAAAAGLARVNPGFAVPMLTQLFAERRGRLQALIQGGGDPTETWEELYWLLLLMGHVMADGGDGEVPQVPQSLLKLSVSYATDVDRDPVTGLSRAVLEFACVSLSAEGRNSLLSPRLMEALVWFLARWAGTYLMRDKTGGSKNGLAGQVRQDQNGANGANGHHLVSEAEGHPALDRAFGEQSGGASTLEALLRISIVSLLEWPGEKDLHAMVCQKLLPSLTRRKTVCRHLVKLGPWQELAQAFASLTPPLSALETSLQRSMAESLCRAAVGFDDKDTAAHYVDSIFGPVVKRVGELAGSQEMKDVAQRPDVQLLVGALLERLRGAARGSAARTQPPLFALGVASFDPMLVLLQVYHNQPLIAYLILKFVVTWVESQVAHLSPEGMATTLRFCVRLLEVYSRNNMGKVSLDASSSLASESRSEKYKDLRALLQLLMHLTSKDLVDFSTPSASNGPEAPDVAQVVFLGLNIVIPLISLELLKYPKLCRQYFSLIAHMLEVYPEKVAVLPQAQFGSIITSLDFGLRHQEPDVITLSLEALSGIASFHYLSASKGEPGLGPHLQASAASENVLAHFLRALLHILLFEDYSSDIVEPAASALLPLILCEHALYQQLYHELLAGQSDADMQGRLASALHTLLGSNGVGLGLDRVNRRKFRQNLQVFLAEVRSFLRTK